MRLHTALVAAAATLLLTVPAHATTRTAAAAHRAAGEPVTMALYEVIDALPVADEDRTGYVRTAFRHWIDADKDGCDARIICMVGLSEQRICPGAAAF